MKWGELKVGDVVAHVNASEVCLLLKRVDNKFTWLVLEGISYQAWGSNPYTVDDTDSNDEIENWDVIHAEST